MKPLMSRKVRRGERLAEWESSEHQATYDGLMEFAARQKARMQAAQAKPAANIAQLRKGAKA